MELKNLFRCKRGMVGDVGGTLITLLVIGVLAYVSIKIFADMSTSLTAGITGNGLAASNNFTAGIWSAIGLLSNVPYLIGALALLGVVMLFGYYAGGGKMK
jgi:hypothetical protein